MKTKTKKRSGPRLRLVATTMAVLAFTACGTAADATTGATAAAAEVSIEEPSPVLVSTEWLADRLDEVVVIHVDMRPDDFLEEHIPGAQYVDWSEFVQDGDVGAEMRTDSEMVAVFESAGVTNDTHVVFYGSHIPAARGFLTLEYLGHDRVSVLDGGITAWKEAGMEVEAGPEAHVQGAFSPNVRADILVDSDWVMANLDNPAYGFVDARPEDEYTGADGGGRGGMMKPGHIPGAHQLFYRDLVVSRDDPRYLDLEALAARFEAAGAQQGETLVSYCMIGMRASVTYMISRHLGFDAKFYDGSWHDWSNKDLPRVEGPEPG